jgi:hypothetical protein
VSLPTFQKSFATLSSSRLYAKEKNNVLKDEADDNFEASVMLDDIFDGWDLVDDQDDGFMLLEDDGP